MENRLNYIAMTLHTCTWFIKQQRIYSFLYCKFKCDIPLLHVWIYFNSYYEQAAETKGCLSGDSNTQCKGNLKTAFLHQQRLGDRTRSGGEF